MLYMSNSCAIITPTASNYAAENGEKKMNTKLYKKAMKALEKFGSKDARSCAIFLNAAGMNPAAAGNWEIQTALEDWLLS